jgi:predicted transcriptional regulator
MSWFRWLFHPIADLWLSPPYVRDATRSVQVVRADPGVSIDIAPPNLYLQDVMETLPVKPERLAQLEEFARRRGKTTADALDDALADYLEWERQDYQETVEAVRQGYEDMKAGRTEPAERFLDEFARKHGLPR